jgi:excisionase family DNA binding protein
MASTVLDQEPTAAIDQEREQLAEVDRLLEMRAPLELVADQGEHVQIPTTVQKLFHQLVHLLAQGHVVTLVPATRQLTTQQAADILNVSRPFLVQLLERGDIPFTRSGTHRRIRFEDLMAYKHTRDARQVEALNELAQLSQEFGLYGTQHNSAR